MAQSETDAAEAAARTEQAKQEQFKDFLRQFVKSLEENERFKEGISNQAERNSVLEGIRQGVGNAINDGDITNDSEFNHILAETTKTQLDEAGISSPHERTGIYLAARQDASRKSEETGKEPGWSPGQQGGAKDKEAWRDEKYTEELTLYGEQDGKDQLPTNLDEIDDKTVKAALQDRWTVNGLVGMGVLEVDKDTGAIKAAEDGQTLQVAVTNYLGKRAAKWPSDGIDSAEEIQGLVRSDVKGIQRMLNMQEGTVYGVDGKFGEETRATMIAKEQSGEKLLGAMIESEKAVSGKPENRATPSPEGGERQPGEEVSPVPATGQATVRGASQTRA